MKKVLAILGSPHTNGATATMLNYAIHQAERLGYQVTKISLYEKNLAFCKGCEMCYKTHICTIQDDLQEIVHLIHECHMIILATPVYWANVPAPVKNLFDRLLGTAMEKTKTFPKPRLKGKQYLILTSCHTPAPFCWLFGQSRGLIRNCDEFFKTAGMKSLGKIVYANPKNQTVLPKQLIKKIHKCLK